MAKQKSKKKNTKAKTQKNTVDDKAANRRGVIIIAAVLALFIAFIVLIAINGSKNKDGTPSTTLTPEQQISQAVEDFEV